MRTLLALTLLCVPAAALAATPEPDCLFDTPLVAWAQRTPTKHASIGEAYEAAGERTPANAALDSRGLRLVSHGARVDLLVRGGDGSVLRHAGVASLGDGESPSLLSAAKGPWIVAAILTEQADPEPDSHPEKYLDQYLVDARTGRVVVEAHETLPSMAWLEEPTLGFDGDELKYELVETSGSRPLADVARCAGPADAKPAALASGWIAVGRKLTAKEPSRAVDAFTQALVYAELPEAYSGRGYARLKLYEKALEKDSSSLEGHRAVEDFEEAVKRSKDDAFLAAVWFNVGQVHELSAGPKLPKYKLEELEKALAAYRTSVRYKARDAVVKRVEATAKAIDALK